MLENRKTRKPKLNKHFITQTNKKSKGNEDQNKEKRRKEKKWD